MKDGEMAHLLNGEDQDKGQVHQSQHPDELVEFMDLLSNFSLFQSFGV